MLQLSHGKSLTGTLFVSSQPRRAEGSNTGVATTPKQLLEKAPISSLAAHLRDTVAPSQLYREISCSRAPRDQTQQETLVIWPLGRGRLQSSLSVPPSIGCDCWDSTSVFSSFEPPALSDAAPAFSDSIPPFSRWLG